MHLCAGIKLFSEKGFDATTASEIAEATGTSRRTFFRYFPSKYDVVFDWLDEQADIIGAHIESRPPGQSPAVALREAMMHVAKFMDADSDRANLPTRIVYETPSLARRYQAENSCWEGEVTAILMRGRPAREAFTLGVQVAVATAGLVSAMRAWASDDRGMDMYHWVRKAFAALQNFHQDE